MHRVEGMMASRCEHLLSWRPVNVRDVGFPGRGHLPPSTNHPGDAVPTPCQQVACAAR